MNVILAAVLGIVSIVSLLGLSVLAANAVHVDKTQVYQDTLEVGLGDPNSLRQSSSNDTSLLQPVAKSE